MPDRDGKGPRKRSWRPSKKKGTLILTIGGILFGVCIGKLK